MDAEANQSESMFDAIGAIRDINSGG